MSNSKQKVNEGLPGGWSKYGPLSKEDKQVFDEALPVNPLVLYKPEAVSEQLVAGMNYRYKCTANYAEWILTEEVIVHIFKPLVGKPFVTAITRM